MSGIYEQQVREARLYCDDEGVGEPRGVDYAERALLGCLILDGGLRMYTRQLKPADFSTPMRGEVFRRLMDTDGPVDLIILATALEDDWVPSPGKNGWTVHLAALLDLLPDVENVEEYVKIARKAAITRRLEARR